MATGICYTWSGNKKKHEYGGFVDRPNQVKWITGYTVGYPSTAYYPGLLCDNFIYWAYPGGPPELLQYPEFTEGTAIYFANSSINRYPPESESEEKNNSYIAYTKIYNLMSYTPPDGYVLDDNGKYTYIAEAKIYSCNEDVKYFNAINSINIGTETIKREFKYSKIIQTNTMDYPVTISINGSMVNCKCNRVTWIPGTNNGNVILGVNITFGGYNGGYGSVDFNWEMRYGINETKGIGIPNPTYSGSGFTTRNDWEVTDSSGNITYYRFVLHIK